MELLQSLSDAGFHVSSVGEICERFAPLPDDLAKLLIEWLPKLADSRDQEAIAWSLLAAPKRLLDGQPLARVFDESASLDLKRALAAVINQTGPNERGDWLVRAIARSEDSATRNLLASAIAKWLPVERSVPALRAAFDLDPLAIVHPLGKVGGADIAQRLRDRLLTATGPLRRELRQAIKRIERRLAKSSNGRQCG